jgi:hypothetical protein
MVPMESPTFLPHMIISGPIPISQDAAPLYLVAASLRANNGNCLNLEKFNPLAVHANGELAGF